MRSLDHTCSYSTEERSELDQTAANMKSTAISSQHPGLCEMNTVSLASLSPCHMHRSGWKHFFIIAFNSMLGVPTVPLLRVKLSWRNISTFVIRDLTHFTVVSLIQLKGHKTPKIICVSLPFSIFQLFPSSGYILIGCVCMPLWNPFHLGII